jgi:hypothetical protein
MTDAYDEYTVVTWPRSELRELSDPTPAKANWHTFDTKVQVVQLGQVPSILMRYYLRKDGQIATVMQRWLGDRVVWDSRHAQPARLAINGAAYRARTRRRKP